MTDEHSAMFRNSIIVVAHPDDEILWLSSVVSNVNTVVFCFEDYADAPELGSGRRKVVAEYPLPVVSSLGIEESGSFNMADWKTPIETPYGLKISKSNSVDTRYQRNYREIETRLADMLGNFENVFTHNPWGEYGHEDHVQIFRAVEALQRRMKFNLWFSNYGGNHSVNLMLSRMSGFCSDYIALPTNRTLASELQALYKLHKCWTWYDDYVWFNDECFMKINTDDNAARSYGHLFPINFMKTDFSPPAEKTDFEKFTQTVHRKLFRR